MLLTRRFMLAGPAILALLSHTATAQTIEQAKAEGWAGEQADGYLGLVKPDAPAAIKQLVEQINLQRRQRYRDIASQNGTNLQAVEIIAGQRLIERTGAGGWIRPTDSGWIKK